MSLIVLANQVSAGGGFDILMMALDLFACPPTPYGIALVGTGSFIIHKENTREKHVREQLKLIDTDEKYRKLLNLYARLGTPRALLDRNIRELVAKGRTEEMAISILYKNHEKEILES